MKESAGRRLLQFLYDKMFCEKNSQAIAIVISKIMINICLYYYTFRCWWLHMHLRIRLRPGQP